MTALSLSADQVFVALASYLLHKDITAVKYAYMSQGQYNAVMGSAWGFHASRREQLITSE